MWAGVDHFTELVSYVVRVHTTAVTRAVTCVYLSMSNEFNNAAKPCRMTRLQKPFQSIWFLLFT